MHIEAQWLIMPYQWKKPPCTPICTTTPCSSPSNHAAFLASAHTQSAISSFHKWRPSRWRSHSTATCGGCRHIPKAWRKGGLGPHGLAFIWSWGWRTSRRDERFLAQGTRFLSHTAAWVRRGNWSSDAWCGGAIHFTPLHPTPPHPHPPRTHPGWSSPSSLRATRTFRASGRAA